jgi:hypothetical protein
VNVVIALVVLAKLTTKLVIYVVCWHDLLFAI